MSEEQTKCIRAYQNLAKDTWPDSGLCFDFGRKRAPMRVIHCPFCGEHIDRLWDEDAASKEEEVSNG